MMNFKLLPNYLAKCLFLGACLAPVMAGAQQGAEPQSSASAYQEPTFTVSGFDIEGPELVPRYRLEQVLEPFVGKPLSFGDLRIATNLAEKLHALRGFEVVRVIVPEQDLQDGGRLKLRVIDARLDTVLITDNEHFSDEQLLSEFPLLEKGALINTLDLDKKIRLINSNPSRTVRVSLEPSFKPGSVDAVMKVSDQKPETYAMTLDNTGTSSTGRYRLGFFAQHSNMFDKAHVATFQAVTSPGKWSDVQVYSLGYKLPVEPLNGLLEFTLSDSNVNAGSLNTGSLNLNVTGAGKTKAVRFTKILDRLSGLEQSLVFSYEIKDFISNVQIVGVTTSSIVPNLQSTPAGVTWVLKDTDSPQKLLLSLGYYKNLPSGDNNSQTIYSQSNANAKIGFNVIRWSGSYSTPIPDGWSVSFKLDGQYSSDTLISGEQFGAGGASSVRGFDERLIAADKGLRQSVQFSGPNWASLVNSEGAATFKLFQPIVFAEAAQLRFNTAASVTKRHLTIGSIGAGLRFNFLDNHIIALDVARVVAGEGSVTGGDHELHFSFALNF